MKRTPKPFLAALVVAGSLAITFGAFAQSTPQNQQGMMMDGGRGMMGGGQGSANQPTTGMMPMMGMMNQMNRMAENCNRMMENAMRHNSAPMPGRKSPG